MRAATYENNKAASSSNWREDSIAETSTLMYYPWALAFFKFVVQELIEWHLCFSDMLLWRGLISFLYTTSWEAYLQMLKNLVMIETISLNVRLKIELFENPNTNHHKLFKRQRDSLVMRFIITFSKITFTFYFEHLLCFDIGDTSCLYLLTVIIDFWNRQSVQVTARILLAGYAEHSLPI